jgi:phosphoribosylformimino-5-aminoimidazole carboxamide ribotide isomerase
MQIWPAIDLRGGKCVRLKQGDYARETVFNDDPLAVARHWVDLGGNCLHLVDLDGAKSGRVENGEVIRAIVQAAAVPCELGGGIRTEEAIAELLGWGLSRLVIGTLAIKQPVWFRGMCRKFPHKLVLGIDAKEGNVATDGWLETSSVSAIELARSFENEPVAAIIYTDIATDGMLRGPNLTAMAEMSTSVQLPVVASGGVSNAKDIANLAQLRLAGCIVGRALYEGAVSLPDALLAARIQPM